MMERKFVVLALMFLAVGGLTSANEEEASSTSPVEATTPNVPPTLNEDDLLSDPPIIEGPSVASPDNELLAPSTEGPPADSPNNAEGPSITSADNEISVPPTQGPSPFEGHVAEVPIGLVDEEGFPIDTAPTPEIEMPPPTVSAPSPPLNPTSTGVPYSGASPSKISSVIVLAGAVGVFSL
ncbi:hypothetical protein LIER_26802 [Lithospermum erythrorhizon]|uniref:Uncharacterized protein n=1 Tax=Lithospermum erythrorhizon TaxID=34254 RepID=A0AAV3R9P1_LITER